MGQRDVVENRDGDRPVADRRSDQSQPSSALATPGGAGRVFIDRLPLLFESETLKRSHRVPPGNGHGGCRVKCEMSSTPTASDLSWLPHAARS